MKEFTLFDGTVMRFTKRILPGTAAEEADFADVNISRFDHLEDREEDFVVCMTKNDLLRLKECVEYLLKPQKTLEKDLFRSV